MAEQIVLGLDTSVVVNVGLAVDGTAVGRWSVADRLAHVEQLTPLLATALAERGLGVRDLTGVVVGLGPGPFTGLRVGVVTAQLLAAVLGLDCRGVCSLDVLAVQHVRGHGPHAGAEFIVATDARRRELYWARYAPDGTRLEGPTVSTPDAVPALPVVGPGAELYPRLRAVPGPRTLDAGLLAEVGPQLPDEGRTPLYLRRPDATEPGRRKSVLPRLGGAA